MAAAGFAFISADYRLLSPCTGRDVLDDIVDLFAFIARTKYLGTAQVDSTRLAVAGNSAGGLCAFLAAIHANPKPRAILSMYAMGGELFVCFHHFLRAYLYLNNAYAHCPRCVALTSQSPHFLSPKTKPFFLGYEILDPAKFSEFFHPANAFRAPIAQSQPTFFGPDSATPGMPSNPRMQLARLWLQLGTYLDYWTGLHEPSISDALREILPVDGEDTATTDARLAATLPPSEHALFPQLLVTPEWPPVMLIHGSKDTAVPVDSSRALHARLQDAKVESTLRIVPDMEHVFDLRPGAEQAFGGLFDEAAEFLRAVVLGA